jgi:hypothetical protein
MICGYSRHEGYGEKNHILLFIHSCPVSSKSQHLLVVRVDGQLFQYKTAPQGDTV